MLCKMTKEWSKKEDNLLLYEIKHNISFDIMSKYHNRTEKELNERIIRIAEKMVKANIEFKTILEMTKLQQIVILELFYKHKLYNKQKRYVIKSIKTDLELIKSHLNI